MNINLMIIILFSFLQSNDIDNPVTVVPITIQVSPPDLFMVGLNNNSFTIAEDDTLETVFYVIGPQGNTTFSISGDTSSFKFLFSFSSLELSIALLAKITNLSLLKGFSKKS